MISHSIITRSNAGSGAVGSIDNYYQDAKDDYYSKENQPSEWQGKLAIDLGLNGNVNKQQFMDLLAGKDPNNYKNKLRDNSFKKKNDNERLAIDLTFSAPKSISIEALVNDKIEVLKAHEMAVTKTLEIIEQKAQARQKTSKKNRKVETTGNLAIAKFRHETNRNLDPQLHTHAVIVNITKRKDGEYRALHNDEIIKNTKDFTKIYQGYLAKQLKELGYHLRVTRDGFELAHINDNQIKAFSTRSQEINAELESKGLNRETATTLDKQSASLGTRKAKTEKDIIQTRASWRLIANELNINSFNNVIKVDVKSNELNQKQKSFNTFDNAFNRNEKIEKINQVEYLYNDRNKQAKAEKSTQKSEIGRTNSTERTIDTTGRTNSTDNKQVESEREPKARSEQGLTSTTRKPENDRNSGYRNTFFLSGENGFREKSIFTKTDSKYKKWEINSEGTENISDDMRIMPRFTMEDTSKRGGVLLPNSEKVYFQQFRTSYDLGLRGSGNSISNDEPRRIEESLDEIMKADLMNDSLSLQWKNKLDNVITENDLDFDELFVSSVEELKSFTVKHLIDKTHTINYDDLKKTLIDKGLGLIDYSDADKIIDEMIKDDQLIKTDAMYKLNGKLYTDYMIRDHIGIYEKIDNETFEKLLEKNNVEKISTVFTTKSGLKIDENILAMLDKSNNSYERAYTKEEAELKLDQTTLKQEQRKASEMILTSDNAVLGIQGYAGTGKSFLISKTKEILEEAGRELHIFAPYSSQVKNLQDDGLEANTVAKFLKSSKMQDSLNENSVIVIDEAGVLNSKQVEQILQVREKIGCQVVLLGDKAQTKAVEAGTPFELLQNNGMETTELKDIQRQKDLDLRQAVISSVQGDFEKSVDNLKNLYEVKSKDERHIAIVQKYLELSESERDNTLIVAGTNADRKNINDLIRDQLETKGKGFDFEKLTKVDLSNAEKEKAVNYHIGEYITMSNVYGKDKKNEIVKDEPYKIIGRNSKKNTLTIQTGSGNKEISIDPKKSINSYTEDKIELSVGDKIRVTTANKEKCLVTGDILEVKSLDKEKGLAYLEDKKGNSFTFKSNEKNFIDHSYAMTINSSQGLTVSNVICDFNTKSQTLGQETYYVGISRAKNNAFIFTDSISDFPNKIANATTKHNATELIDNYFNEKENKNFVHVFGENDLSKTRINSNQVEIVKTLLNDDYSDGKITFDKRDSSFSYKSESLSLQVNVSGSVLIKGQDGLDDILIQDRKEALKHLNFDFDNQDLLSKEVKENTILKSENKSIFVESKKDNEKDKGRGFDLEM